MSGYQLGTGSNWIYLMLVILPWHMSIDTEQMGNPSPILIPTTRRLLLAQTQKDTLMAVTQSVSPSRCQATLSTMALKIPLISHATFPQCVFIGVPFPELIFRSVGIFDNYTNGHHRLPSFAPLTRLVFRSSQQFS